MKHTEGPWKIVQCIPDKPKYEGETITTLVDDNNRSLLNRSNPIEEASNANLIIAAPELLEICIEIEEQSRKRLPVKKETWLKLCRIIDKAERRQ